MERVAELTHEQRTSQLYSVQNSRLQTHLEGASEVLLRKTLALRVTAAATARGAVAVADSKLLLLCWSLEGLLAGPSPA